MKGENAPSYSDDMHVPCRNNGVNQSGLNNRSTFFYERLMDEDELKAMVRVSSHALFGSLLDKTHSRSYLNPKHCYNTNTTDQDETKRIANGLLNNKDKSLKICPKKEDSTSCIRPKSTQDIRIERNTGRIQRWHLYRKVETKRYDESDRFIDKTMPEKGRPDENCPEVVVVDLKVGDRLNGHDGIVHGGIVALFFDEAMGCGYNVVMKQNSVNPQAGFTAMLQTNFRSPVLQNKSYIIRVHHNKGKSSGTRKVYITAVLTNYDASVLYAEAEALFITSPKSKL